MTFGEPEEGQQNTEEVHANEGRFGKEELDTIFGEIIAFKKVGQNIGNAGEMVFERKIFSKANEKTDEIADNDNRGEKVKFLLKITTLFSVKLQKTEETRESEDDGDAGGEIIVEAAVEENCSNGGQ